MNGQDKGIIGLLFDFGFTDFITKKLLKLLYIAGMAIAGLGALAFLATGFSQGMGLGLLALLVSPVIFLFGVALVRIQLELVMVLFKIEENTRTNAGSGPRGG